MDGDAPTAWQLVRFEECLERWSEVDKPDDDTTLRVVAWIMSRFDNPYSGMRREPVHPNLWFGAVPDTLDAAATVVACSYFVFDRTKIVRCDSIARLSLPL